MSAVMQQDPAAKPLVLCVDDERQVLEAIAPHLRREFEVHVATSGAEGLAILTAQGPFCAVVSDMRMPGMNGAEFLTRVRETSPDTARILLTGFSDVDAAAAAINEGQIFRFLMKPCPPRTLIGSVREGVQQFELRQMERRLLEQTLMGAIEVLSEMLGLVHPDAFGQAMRLRRVVRQVASAMKLSDAWEIELAALLSQIGVIAIPPSVLERVAAGKPLTAEQQRAWQEHPLVARRLIQRIPRLEGVAQIVGRQDEAPSEGATRDAIAKGDRIALAAQMLRMVRDFDDRVAAGESNAVAMVALERCEGAYLPEALAALRSMLPKEQQLSIMGLSIEKLRPGMVLLDDVRTRTGMLVVKGGTEVTATVKERLARFSAGAGVEEPIRVRVPAWLREV